MLALTRPFLVNFPTGAASSDGNPPFVGTSSATIFDRLARCLNLDSRFGTFVIEPPHLPAGLSCMFPDKTIGRAPRFDPSMATC